MGLLVQGNRKWWVVFTLTKGRGYNGAALFGTLANSGRRIKGFPNIAISRGVKDVGKTGGYSIISLPNVCSVEPCARRRVISQSFVLSNGPSKVVGVISTAGVRQGLCLALRLLRLGLPVILTLGVVSRIETGNKAIGIGGLDRDLNVPMVPVDTTGGRNISRLTSGVMCITGGHVLPGEVSFYSSNPMRHYVRSMTRIVRSRTQGVSIPPEFYSAGLVRNSRCFTSGLRLSGGRQRLVRRDIIRVRRSANLSHGTTLTSVQCAFVRGTISRSIIGYHRDHRRGQDIGVSGVLAKGCATLPIFFNMVFLMF